MLLIPGVVNVIDGDKSRKSQNYGDTYLSDSRVILVKCSDTNNGETSIVVIP